MHQNNFGVNAKSGINPNSNSQNNSTGGSSYLTSSYVPSEEIRNKLLHHSPSISPMTHCNVILDTEPPITSLPKTNRRRRSSSKEENARKRRDLKAQHSIIEKKRRIKMNREFEALKFLIPACRGSILSGLTESSFENSNSMHKLTILQSTVEYIKYLHLIIRLIKMQMFIPKESRSFFKNWFKTNGDMNFVDFDLNLQEYRNINEDYDFENLFKMVYKNNGKMPETLLDPIHKSISQFLQDDYGNEEDEDEYQENNCSEEVNISANDEVDVAASASSLELNDFNSSTVFKKQIIENKNYRKSILQSQNNIDSSFKLPLPAIIDKHPDLTKFEKSVEPQLHSTVSPIKYSSNDSLNLGKNCYIPKRKFSCGESERNPVCFEADSPLLVPIPNTTNFPISNLPDSLEYTVSDNYRSISSIKNSSSSSSSTSKSNSFVSSLIKEQRESQVYNYTHNNEKLMPTNLKVQEEINVAGKLLASMRQANRRTSIEDILN